MTRWGTIRSRDGFRYALTDDDVLWAARMVQREGSVTEVPHILWTLTQHFAAERAMHGRQVHKSFFSLLRDYSQPINPRWYRDGACCAPGATGCPAGGASWFGRCDRVHCPCSEGRLLAREELARQGLPDLDPRKVNLVLRWARGQLDNPVPGAVHFASSAAGRPDTYRARFPGGHVVARLGNYYGTVASTDRWRRGHVWIDAGDSWVALAAALGVAAGALVASWRRGA